MPKVLERAVRLTLALAVAGGLGFGASTAVASTALPDCSHIVPYQSCANASVCAEPCLTYFGPYAVGRCSNNCCVCDFE